MRWERGWWIRTGGGLASGLIATSAWAQVPVPPTGPAPAVVCEERPRPVKQFFKHSLRVLQDNWMGYPQEFVEPPPGYYNAEMFGIMRAKADPHRFTLYRSDFLDGTDRLSPAGAARFNLMASRLRTWPGPVLIEWSPEQPALADARRQSVLALLQNVGVPVVADRVVVGPSPFPGLLGTGAANNYSIMITRDQAAPSTYSLSPSSAGTFNSGAFGGGAP